MSNGNQRTINRRCSGNRNWDEQRESTNKHKIDLPAMQRESNPTSRARNINSVPHCNVDSAVNLMDVNCEATLATSSVGSRPDDLFHQQLDFGDIIKKLDFGNNLTICFINNLSSAISFKILTLATI